MLFGSKVLHSNSTASADSPCESNKLPDNPSRYIWPQANSQMLLNPSPSASHSASSGLNGSKDQLLPPVYVVPTHLRFSISQPSGIPSPSVSLFVASSGESEPPVSKYESAAPLFASQTYSCSTI